MQTVQKKGYRFVAEVEVVVEDGGRKGTTQAASATAEAPKGLELAKTEVSETAGADVVSRVATEKAKSSKRKWIWIAAATGILLAGSAVKFGWPRLTRAEKEPTIRSIAVLPLENISGDKEQEFFADGMTDELITMLAKYPSLRVISRTSVMQYKGVRRPLPEIAKELGVDGVIEGSV